MYKVIIIGQGAEFDKIRSAVGCNPSFELKGVCDQTEVLDCLSRTELFFSGCETEALGISYIEALAAGCKVVMPAAGGGLEIAGDAIEKSIFVFPVGFEADDIYSSIERAILAPSRRVNLERFTPKSCARAYLDAAN